MNDTNPLAVLEEMAGHWFTPGQCCTGYCTNGIHGLSRDDSEQVKTAARTALAEARQAVDALVAERDALAAAIEALTASLSQPATDEEAGQ